MKHRIVIALPNTFDGTISLATRADISIVREVERIGFNSKTDLPEKTACYDLVKTDHNVPVNIPTLQRFAALVRELDGV